MIKVSETGSKGCTVEFYGTAEVVAQQYAALTMSLAENELEVLVRAQQLIDQEVKRNDKTDINNN